MSVTPICKGLTRALTGSNIQEGLVLSILWSVFLVLFYVAIGAVGAIWLRWNRRDEGTDLLLDVVMWPLLLYYAVFRNG